MTDVRTTDSHDSLDPRGPQFSAALTSVVLALALLLAPRPAGVALLALQTVVFALGAARGVQHTPTAALFRRYVRPRLGPPTHLEDPRPPRFAQAVGLTFAVVALIGYLAGSTTLGAVATGLALVAALLNAVFGLCLGCELYLLGRRAFVGSRPAGDAGSPAHDRPTPDAARAAAYQPPVPTIQTTDKKEVHR